MTMTIDPSLFIEMDRLRADLARVQALASEEIAKRHDLEDEVDRLRRVIQAAKEMAEAHEDRSLAAHIIMWMQEATLSESVEHKERT